MGMTCLDASSPLHLFLWAQVMVLFVALRVACIWWHQMASCYPLTCLAPPLGKCWVRQPVCYLVLCAQSLRRDRKGNNCRHLWNFVLVRWRHSWRRVKICWWWSGLVACDFHVCGGWQISDSRWIWADTTVENLHRRRMCLLPGTFALYYTWFSTITR